MITSYNCICCNTKISLLYPDLYKYRNTPESLMWDDGTVTKIYPTYGSKYDTTCLVTGICDNCIAKKIEDKVILYHTDEN